MAEIARWTTPAITYKPAEVSADEILDIVMTIKQNGQTIIRRNIDDAITDAEGFTWQLSQQETARLTTRTPASVKFDFTTSTKRFTTKARQYEVINSAIEEEL